MRAFFHIVMGTTVFLGVFLGAFILISALFAVYLIHWPQNLRPNTSSGSIVIDYNALTRKLDPMAIGMDVSGYIAPSVFANDQDEQQKIKRLGIKYMRMELKYSTPQDPTSMIICAANGCDARWTGDQWVQAMKKNGIQPLVMVSSNPVDAANMVKHFNKDTHNYVKYWVIGNEPDLAGVSVLTYSDSFNQDYDAMKAIDPTIKIGGGTTAWYNTSFLQTFLQLSGSRVDFVDFHGYAQRGNVSGDYTTLFHFAEDYGKNINHLRSLIQQTIPDRASQIGIEVGEWELNWAGGAQNNTNFHAVWAASVLGHVLSSGGWSLFYADKENALYGHQQTITDSRGRMVNVNVNDTTPAYHGVGMFTGEQLFRGFGDTMVQATTKLPNIEVYASDNPKNIVVINKDPSMAQTATVDLHGATAETVSVWRKDEFVPFPDPPLQLSSQSLLDGTFTCQLPPFSITTFVLNV